MRIVLNIPPSIPLLNGALEGLVGADAAWLRKYEEPLLYESGIRYRREKRKVEEWDIIPRVLDKGWGDCEDLAAWRAAELRVEEGEPARAIAVRTGPEKFHAVVRRADGRIEDPSRALGMKRARPWPR